MKARLAFWLVVVMSCTTSTAWAAPAVDGLALVRAARAQVGVTVRYDPAYRELTFPNGDVPLDRGVCTDVVVRALRVAYGFDLQARMHDDMKRNWKAYPRELRWMQFRPDWNIDHRRVPNQMTFLARHGMSLALGTDAESFLPGDIVAWDLNGRQLHIGIVSDRRAVTGTPLVIHNIGRGAREEDVLFRFRMIGHYRLHKLE